jgi:hypothetical protein
MCPDNPASINLAPSIAAKPSLFASGKALDRPALRLMPHGAVLGHGQEPADCN